MGIPQSIPYPGFASVVDTGGKFCTTNFASCDYGPSLLKVIKYCFGKNVLKTVTFLSTVTLLGTVFDLYM
jgi:hypothetical protein